MKRILYFSGYRMVAQEWRGRRLASSVYFEPDEQGLDLFEAYLSSFSNEPVSLMLDLIEEEFRKIKIPLLRGKDRNGVIERNFTRYFRNSDYRYAASQLVEKKGRKEEHLLLTGLTNQELIKPWLAIIDRTKTPLAGILTLPLVSEGLISRFKSENDCDILVSQQVPSNLRQSVFLHGKLILSRLVPIASFYQGEYAADVIRDIESTKRYLVSQRIIDRNDEISIHILCNKRHEKELSGKCVSDGVFDYHINNINTYIAREKIEVDDEQDFSSVIFCHQATQKPRANHYANNEAKKYYYHHLAILGSKVASVALLAISVGLLSVSVARGVLYNASASEMKLLEQKYKSKFNQLNEQRADTDISTSNLKNVVQTIDTLKNKYSLSPLQMMTMISGDIALFSDMRVNSMSWFVASSPDAEEADPQSSITEKKNRRSFRRTVAKPKTSLYEIVDLEGELLNFDGDYRYALSLVNDIEDTMSVSGKYSSVTVTRRPLSIESSEQISGDAGIRFNQKGRTNQKAGYALRVVREVKLDGK